MSLDPNDPAGLLERLLSRVAADQPDGTLAADLERTLAGLQGLLQNAERADALSEAERDLLALAFALVDERLAQAVRAYHVKVGDA